MTQEERLIEYLQDNKTINPLRAWQDISIYRLSAYIHRLRKIGYNITTKRLSVINRYGEKCSVANYVLED